MSLNSRGAWATSRRKAVKLACRSSRFGLPAHPLESPPKGVIHHYQPRGDVSVVGRASAAKRKAPCGGHGAFESAVWRLRGPQFRGCTLLILETRGALESSAMRGWAPSLHVTIKDATGRAATQVGCLIRSAQRR